MKKFLLSFALVASIFGGFTACSEQAKWNRSERQAMRELLRDYRKMVYLNDLTEAEYMLFADRVIASVEEEYPVYTTFIEMPAVNDTVQVYIITTIVEELAADARNMRHIFPYASLVASNTLPAGLDRIQQNAFYRCLAQKVDDTYPTIDSFVNALVADTTATSTIKSLQQQCATDLFGWSIEIVDIIEQP